MKMLDSPDFINWVIDNYIYDIPYFDDWLDLALKEPESRERETLEHFYELYNKENNND